MILLLVAGCAEEGGYELHWKVGGADPMDACSLNGLDFVRVDVVRGEGNDCGGEVVDTTDYACHDGVGAQSLIDAGTYKLCAQAFSPARIPLVDPVVAPDVRIDDGKTAVIEIDFPAVPQCRNGIDDDGDGYIDLDDPQCSDGSDGELPACANGVDDDGDGYTDLEDPECSDASDDVE